MDCIVFLHRVSMLEASLFSLWQLCLRVSPANKTYQVVLVKLRWFNLFANPLHTHLQSLRLAGVDQVTGYCD